MAPVIHGDRWLAPVKPGKLALPVGDLRQGLIEAMAAVIAHAVAQGEVPGGDRVAAVHEFRKSVRRARAVLALCKGLLPADEFHALWRRLRKAARPTSALRDSDVFAEVLGTVAVPDELKEAAASAKEWLCSDSEADDVILPVLEHGVELVRPVPERFAAALRTEVSWADLEAGLRRSYASARRRLVKVRKTGEVAHFHDWRKRTKELNYQIELLAYGLAGELGALRDRFADVATELGQVTDRSNLASRLASEAEGRKQRKLAKTVRKEGRAMLRTAIVDGEALFAARPREFAHELIARIREARGVLATAPG